MGVWGGEIGVKLVHWNPDGFKIGLCDVTPAAQTKALLCLANKYACVCVFECGCVGVWVCVHAQVCCGLAPLLQQPLSRLTLAPNSPDPN